jgi:maltose operon protein
MPIARLTIAVSLCALHLAGCATSTAGTPASDAGRLAAYQRASECCTDPAAFPFEPLPAAGSVRRRIDPTTPLFEFQSGRSHFAAYRLPDGDEPFRVRVKSFFEGPGGPGGHVFYPVAALLDESLFVSRVTGVDSLRLDLGLTVPGGESGLSVTVPLDRRVARERYLIVFTPGVMLGAAPDERREGDLLTATTQAWMDRHQAAFVEPSPYGRIEVTVIPGLPLVEATRDDDGS